MDSAVNVRPGDESAGLPLPSSLNGPVASLHLYGVSGVGVGRALIRMGTSRRQLRNVPGLRFWKLLGTGDGRTFTVQDADPNRWGLFAVWDSIENMRAYEMSRSGLGWSSMADETWSAVLRPLASHGLWAGREPFAGINLSRSPGAPGGSIGSPARVAALTRARIRPSQWRAFWNAVPPVATAASNAPGLQWAVGIGEAPVGLQATFSLWDSESSLRTFAYQGAAHSVAIEQTKLTGWYSEELFARFEVLSTQGTVEGVAW
jgi:hypothetical protein